MKRLARLILVALLVVRYWFPIMLIVRSLYRSTRSRLIHRWIVFLFDPNSIRRNTGRAIPSRFRCVKGVLGERLRVNLGDHLGWTIFLQGYFDLVPPVVALALNRARAGGVYLDIGANIGDTSIAVATRGIETVGIDASAGAISELCHNIALNSPIPYTVVHAAVASHRSKRQGRIDADYVELHEPPGNSASASVYADWNRSRASHSSFLAFPQSVANIVDSLSIESICCIKLDVEGAEHEALRGMRPILERHRCPLVFEYRLDHLSRLTEQSESLLDLLPQGYNCFSVECTRIDAATVLLRISDFDHRRSYENVLATYGGLPEALVSARSDTGMKVQLD